MVLEYICIVENKENISRYIKKVVVKWFLETTRTSNGLKGHRCKPRGYRC